MTKKQIRNLATASYTENQLDNKKVNRISKILTRSELKEYIKAVINLEKSKTVTVYSSKISAGESLKKDIGKLFQNKKIIIKEDKKLIAGIKIIDNDNVYDFSVRNNLKNLVSYIVNK
jgi:F0F1-type ATP synthase delta subunit